MEAQKDWNLGDRMQDNGVVRAENRGHSDQEPESEGAGSASKPCSPSPSESPWIAHPVRPRPQRVLLKPFVALIALTYRYKMIS